MKDKLWEFYKKKRCRRMGDRVPQPCHTSLALCKLQLQHWAIAIVLNFKRRIPFKMTLYASQKSEKIGKIYCLMPISWV